MCCFSETMRIHFCCGSYQMICGSRKSGMSEVSTGLAAYLVNVLPLSVL